MGGKTACAQHKKYLKSVPILITPVFRNYAAETCVVQPYSYLINTIVLSINYIVYIICLANYSCKFGFTLRLALRHTGVLDNRLVHRHTGVQVYSGTYLECWYAVPEARTLYMNCIHTGSSYNCLTCTYA